MTWKSLRSRNIFSAGFFTLRSDACQLPDGREMPNYYVMEFLDWVNVIALDPAGGMILVEQYRHAAGATFREIPGGSTDPGEPPLAAAKRELREETGYASETWVDCGFHHPNPALQNNRVHTFLALDCARVAEPELDPFEDLIVHVEPVAKVYDQWLAGEIKHALISASLALGWRPLRTRGRLG